MILIVAINMTQELCIHWYPINRFDQLLNLKSHVMKLGVLSYIHLRKKLRTNVINDMVKRVNMTESMTRK